jgi:2-polyprenyl-3-methyl-5-hydroxy-6-metoxy-1,4-benzoquinol methylase
MLPARLALAYRLDIVEQRARRLAEKFGVPQAWLQEFHGFLTDARMTSEEFWVRYTLKRLAAHDALEQVHDEASARAFYTTSDYMLWRNVVHRRHSAWRRVLVTLHGPSGYMLEYGCGTAPVTAWVAARKPHWHYTISDLASPHRDYAAWRLQEYEVHVTGVETILPNYDVITLLDVLEHTPDPLKVADACAGSLRRGGYLHWNFVGNPRRNDLDLATDEQRDETIAFLSTHLKLVWEHEGYRVSQVC